MNVEDFDVWYAEQRRALAPALAAWCGDSGVAADALDEAFTRAVERWDRVSRLTSPTGWVWRTATNVVRRRARRATLEVRLLRRTHGGQSALVDGPSADGIDLRRALLGLTERQRTAVVLHHIADLPHRDVADAMGIAEGTVAATLHQARRRLAETLTETPPEMPTLRSGLPSRTHGAPP